MNPPFSSGDPKSYEKLKHSFKILIKKKPKHKILHRADLIPPVLLKDCKVYSSLPLMLRELSENISNSAKYVHAGISLNASTSPLCCITQGSELYIVSNSDRDGFSASLRDSMNNNYLLKGPLRQAILDFDPYFFDLMLLEGTNLLSGFTLNLDACASRLKQSGILVCTSYCHFSVFDFEAYGVPAALNSFVISCGWPVLGLALNPYGFMSMAVQKPY